MSFKWTVWQIVQVASTDVESRLYRISRAFDQFILTLIVLNVLAVIIESVGAVRMEYGSWMYAFELFSVAVFSIEYVARVWACTESDAYRHPVWGRLRFAVTPMALVDLVAVLPFYLPFLGIDFRSVRALRLFRLFRLAKVGRYVASLQILGRVFRSKREELVLTSSMIVILLVVASTLMYFAERSVQPEVFDDIPSTMWWAVATLTTVGYGDVYPVTALGKMLASVIAVMGIGLFALPAGILGSGFVEEIERKNQTLRCPHCGERIHDPVVVPEDEAGTSE